MDLFLTITSAYDTLTEHQQVFAAEAENDLIRLPPHVGEGYIQGVQLTNGISVLLYDFVLRQSLTVRTVVEKTADTYSIFLNVLANRVDKHLGDEAETLSRHSATGLFFYSPDTTSQAVYAPDERYVLLFLTFTRAGLLPLLDAGAAPALLAPENRFGYYQSVDLTIEGLAKQIFRAHEAPLSKMRLLSQTTLLIDHVLRASLSEGKQDLSGFLQDDLQKLFEARKLLTVRHENPPTIAELSSLVGMSETKLKRAFKQVFELSIHQYGQSVRMLRAKELLESKRFSASEVAYQVGYSNLTHFGEAFRKRYGVLPGQFLGTVLHSATVTEMAGMG